MGRRRRLRTGAIIVLIVVAVVLIVAAVVTSARAGRAQEHPHDRPSGDLLATTMLAEQFTAETGGPTDALVIRATPPTGH